MQTRLIAITSIGLIVLAGVGYAIVQPDALAGLADSLRGAVATTTYDSYTRHYGVVFVVNGVGLKTVTGFAGCDERLLLVEPTDGSDRFSQPAPRSTVARCTVTFAGAVDPRIATWVRDVVNGNEVPPTVGFQFLDRYGVAASGITFATARLSNFSAPALDGDSDSLESRYSVTFQAESVSATIPQATSYGAPAILTSKDGTTSRLYTNSFRVDLSTNVVTLRGISLSRAMVPDESVDAKAVVYAPGKVVFGEVDLKLAKLDADAANLRAWVRDARDGDSASKDVSIDHLRSNAAVGNTYRLMGAFPVAFNEHEYAAGGSVATMSLTLKVDRIEIL